MGKNMRIRGKSNKRKIEKQMKKMAKKRDYEIL